MTKLLRTTGLARGRHLLAELEPLDPRLDGLDGRDLVLEAKLLVGHSEKEIPGG